jgi:hypothetical protein
VLNFTLSQAVSRSVNSAVKVQVNSEPDDGFYDLMCGIYRPNAGILEKKRVSVD